MWRPHPPIRRWRTAAKPSSAGPRGLGIEHAFARNWSAKLEYLYVCLGRIDQGSVCTTSMDSSNVSIKQSVVRLGINYKFSGP